MWRSKVLALDIILSVSDTRVLIRKMEGEVNDSWSDQRGNPISLEEDV